MKAYINARHWNEAHEDTFGLAGATCDLPNDTEAALRKLAEFGRFSISFIDDGLPTIVFENEYDSIVHPDAHLSPVEFAEKHFGKGAAAKIRRAQKKNQRKGR